jgi:hypothetical protein
LAFDFWDELRNSNGIAQSFISSFIPEGVYKSRGIAAIPPRVAMVEEMDARPR